MGGLGSLQVGSCEGKKELRETKKRGRRWTSVIFRRRHRRAFLEGELEKEGEMGGKLRRTDRRGARVYQEVQGPSEAGEELDNLAALDQLGHFVRV